MTCIQNAVGYAEQLEVDSKQKHDRFTSMKLNMTSTHVVCIHPSKPSPWGATFFVLLCCEKQFFKVYGPCRKGCTWQDPYLPHNSSKIFVLEFVQVGGTSIPATTVGVRNPQSIPINGIFFASLQTTNQKLTRFIPSQLRSSKPRSRYWWCFINQATRKWQVNFMLNFASWQLLEDRLPRENHESKKNCTVILFVGRGGIQPFPGNYQKNTCCHLRGIFACHLNSFKFQDDYTYNIIQYYYTSITRVSRHFCIQIYRQQAPLNPSGQFCRASLLAHDPLQNKQDHRS